MVTKTVHGTASTPCEYLQRNRGGWNPSSDKLFWQIVKHAIQCSFLQFSLCITEVLSGFVDFIPILAGNFGCQLCILKQTSLSHPFLLSEIFHRLSLKENMVSFGNYAILGKDVSLVHLKYLIIRWGLKKLGQLIFTLVNLGSIRLRLFDLKREE